MAGLSSDIERFHLDQRTAFPGDLEDLVNTITVGDADIEAVAFSSGNINEWEGPYVESTIPATAAAGDAAIATALDGSVLDGLGPYDAAAGASGAGACGADIWISIKITGLSETDVELVNDVIDGETETDGAGAGESQVVDRMRYFAATPDTTF